MCSPALRTPPVVKTCLHGSGASVVRTDVLVDPVDDRLDPYPYREPRDGQRRKLAMGPPHPGIVNPGQRNTTPPLSQNQLLVRTTYSISKTNSTLPADATAAATPSIGVACGSRACASLSSRPVNLQHRTKTGTNSGTGPMPAHYGPMPTPEQISQHEMTVIGT